MKTENPTPRFRTVIATLLTATAAGGCTYAPGMYFGHKTGNSTYSVPDQPASYTETTDDGQVLRITKLTADAIALLSARKVEKLSPPELSGLTTDSSHYQYKLGAGDIVRVVVWDHPELNNPGLSTSPNQNGAAAVATASANNDPLGRTIQPDGTLFFPFVGRVAAAGKTVSQLRADLTARLAAYIATPQLDITITNFRSQKLVISGEVARPGVVQVTDVPLLVTDALNTVGGITGEAALESAFLVRKHQKIPLNLYSLLYKGNLSNNFVLQDGDLLTIPERRFDKIFIAGEFLKTTPVVLPKGRYTLTEAISDSLGVSQLSSNARYIYVIRQEQDGLTDVYNLDAQSPAAMALGDQFVLEPRDIVYVDPTQVTRFGRLIGQVLVPLTSGASNIKNAGGF